MIIDLDNFGVEYWANRFSQEFIDQSNHLELKGQRFLPNTSITKDEYISRYANSSAAFVHEVEDWAGHFFERRIYLKSTVQPHEVARAFYKFYSASSDIYKIQSLEGCLGTKRSIEKNAPYNSIEEAIFIARFLDADNWGFINWRIMALLRHNSVSEIIKECVPAKAAELAIAYRSYTVNEAIRSLTKIRTCICDHLRRASDVSTALFLLSKVVVGLKDRAKIASLDAV